MEELNSPLQLLAFGLFKLLHVWITYNFCSKEDNCKRVDRVDTYIANIKYMNSYFENEEKRRKHFHVSLEIVFFLLMKLTLLTGTPVHAHKRYS